MRPIWITLSLAAALLAQEPAPRAPHGFRYAVPGWEFAFPRDHGAHEAFQTEWWYFTGHLTAARGARYGFELTFFRVGVDPEPAHRTAWDLDALALAHFAISDLGRTRFTFHEKVNRMSPFTAGAATGRLDVFNEGWIATTLPDGSWRIRAAAEGDAIDLRLRAAKPPAVHGERGISVKGSAHGAASHYYSMPRLVASGTLRAGGGETRRCDGIVWMDHEFSTSVLGPDQQGWDWFSLQLEDGTELMLYRMRNRDGSIDPASSGSFIGRAGNVVPLRGSEYAIRARGSWRSPRSGALYPMGWRVTVPSRGIDLTIDPEMEEQELVTEASTGIAYWEGAVRARGVARGARVSGKGYVEMTGYAAAVRPR